MSDDTSRSLLDRIVAGDGDDWITFVDIYRPLILNYLALRNVPRDDLDDVCQESLTQVFRSIGDFRHNGRTGAFRKWLKIIVAQQAWRYGKAAGREKVTLVSEGGEPLAFDSELELQWDLEHDRYVIQRLLRIVRREFSSSSWHAFQLMVVEGVPAGEAAARLAISVNAALIAKSRMMRRLRQLGRGLIDVVQCESLGADA